MVFVPRQRSFQVWVYLQADLDRSRNHWEYYLKHEGEMVDQQNVHGRSAVTGWPRAVGIQRTACAMIAQLALVVMRSPQTVTVMTVHFVAPQ
jgi:hypothetical protein